jgi:hypothetical protein
MRWNRAIRTTAFFAAFVLLAACGGKLGGLSDADLQDHVYECNTAQSQSPGFAISCDNYRRECKRRRDDGNYVC